MSATIQNDPEFNEAQPKRGTGRGIKLINVLIAVGVIGIAIALFLPNVRTVGPVARRAQCVNNLKQIGLALQNYERTYNTLPPAYTVDASGRPLHSWRTLILPFLELGSLYETIDFSKPWNAPANAKALAKAPYVFRCPEQAAPPGTTTYLAVATPNGCIAPDKPRRLSEITDSHDSTLLVIEAGDERAVPWMAPQDGDESLLMSLGPKAKLHHAGGTNACCLDCYVMFLKADTPVEVRRALLSIAGNDNDIAKTEH